MKKVIKALIVIHDHQALVRKADEEVVNMLPRSVEVVIGDVGDPLTVKAAVEGCNKIIYCATARSTITGDLFRVDHRGVYNLTKAFQVWPHILKHLYYLSLEILYVCGKHAS